MSRTTSLLALVWLAGAAGCERVIDVGGEATQGVGFDAGAADGSSEVPPSDEPDPIFGSSATHEQFEQFARDISGRWYGIVTREPEEQPIRVELDFVPGDSGIRGEYFAVCTDGDHCEPFGSGSGGEGRYGLKHLEASDTNVGAAIGFLAWHDDGDDEQISFREMLLQRDGGVLSFRFNPSLPGPSGERTAILVRTKPVMPDDDGGTHPTDGGGL